jgi:hypothetical protein
MWGFSVNLKPGKSIREREREKERETGNILYM